MTALIGNRLGTAAIATALAALLLSSGARAQSSGGGLSNFFDNIFTGSGPRPSPPVIRRMLVIVSTDAPTLLLSIGMGE